MGNLWNIARKEFVDFMESRFIIIVTLIFLITFSINAYSVNANYYTHGSAIGSLLAYSRFGLISGLSQQGLLSTLQGALCNILLSFGGIIALLMGYLAISNERRNNALTTMITKPLFRDTIINGKLLGAVAFLASFFIFISAVYTLCMILIVGDAFNSIIYAYLTSIPLVIIMALLCVMVYYSYSLIISIFVKNGTLALFMCALSWLILREVPNISWNLRVFFGQSVYQSLISIFPETLIMIPITNYVGDYARYNGDLINVVLTNSTNFVELGVYLIILIIISYIAFLRRDIS